MIPTLCSNNGCGSYDAAGIKNICGKCFREWFDDNTTKSKMESQVLESPMITPFCSNNGCGSYDAAGIKNICGKCFKDWFDNTTKSKIESESPIFDLCTSIDRCENSNNKN
uniref:Zinc finger A20 and AN1 domain-containing stress-associated protein 12-like n=1 Tax=Cicer arietinum TaxID=3827 RepID=A0A1S3DWK8_CICAR|nr:zinc finger A20 and AN1 domain-containing stress-associated protein 12-like [Cicer arietinum]